MANGWNVEVVNERFERMGWLAHDKEERPFIALAREEASLFELCPDIAKITPRLLAAEEETTGSPFLGPVILVARAV